MNRLHHDGPLIIGGGLAGLSAALEAGPRKVLLVTPAPLLEACSSAWAQGWRSVTVSGMPSQANENWQALRRFWFWNTTPQIVSG